MQNTFLAVFFIYSTMTEQNCN